MRKFTISMASSRSATNWPRKEISWDDFLGKIKNPVRGKETQDEYLKMPKTEQDNLKDVGGFVGGCMEGDRRLKSKVEKRSMITLDFDDIPSYKTDDVIARVMCLGCMSAVYSTRKHRPAYPRLRVIIPLDRDCSADEYEAIARKAASLIGIDMCDPVSFRPNQLMHWPSCSADGEYICESLEGPLCKVNGILGMYGDWHDVSEWPITVRENKKVTRDAKKMEDPLSKRGVVGDFCRAYNIPEAIERFIPDVYAPSDDPRRFTFVGGSTSAGAWIVDDSGNILHSFHTTDPCGTVNSFDMVRIHKFGMLDDDVQEVTRITSCPSFKAMTEFAYKDEKVRLEKAKSEEEANMLLPSIFGEDCVVQGQEQDARLAGADNASWRTNLELDKNGVPVPTIDNVLWFLSCDIGLSGRIWHDKFSDRDMVTLPVPWDQKSTGDRIWGNDDDSGLKWYIERKLSKVVSESKYKDAIGLTFSHNHRDVCLDYLKNLRWDKVPRLDTYFIQLLGAEDTTYVRDVTRKFIVAAVGRQFSPGMKFDNMLILGGDQGIGKSTSVKILGGEWYTDSMEQFEGKDTFELLRGKMLVEVGELSAMSKNDVRKVKDFLVKEYDEFRPPYKPRSIIYPRRCLFVGTTNDEEFLQDTTGNRRFWPIDCHNTEYDKDAFEWARKNRDQILAEAVYVFLTGEVLYLEGDSKAESIKKQKDHALLTGREGVIEEFLNRDIPDNWYEMSESQRKMFLNGNLTVEKTVKRDRVCISEIWVYCLGGSIKDIDREKKSIKRSVANIGGWKPTTGAYRFGNMGRERGYVRPNSN